MNRIWWIIFWASCLTTISWCYLWIICINSISAQRWFRIDVEEWYYILFLPNGDIEYNERFESLMCMSLTRPT
jgi:hypothetical protein